MPVAYVSSAGASLASGGSSNLVLTPVGGAVPQGQLLLVSIIISANVTITPPSNTVPWNTTVNAAGVKGYWKVAGASEPSSYTFVRGANTNAIVGTIVRLTGAHATAPIDAAAAQAGTSGTNIIIPSLTAGAAASFLIQIASSLTTCTFTPPTTALKVADAQHASNSLSSAVGHEPISSGATGSRTWVASVSGTISGIMWSIIPTNGINRASTLYPRNVATIDTGTGIDVRLLSDAAGGVTDDTSSAQFTHANDSVERTFDPATANVTNTNNAGTTLFKTGWALRLVDDMTPVDDTNCVAILPAGTVTFNALMVPTITGNVPLTGNLAPTWRASLWRYNPATDTGTLIIGGASGVGVTWNCNSVNNDTGVAKAITLNLVVPSQVTFAAGEVLLLQVGLNTNNVPNPLTGTMTVSFAIRVGSTSTNIAFATNQNIMQTCAMTQDVIGEGLTSRGGLPATLTLNAVGEGLTTSSKAVAAAKTTDVVGEGLSSRTLAGAIERTPVGEGLLSMSRSVVAAKVLDVAGEGLVSRDALVIVLSRSATAEGLASSTKLAVVSKTFTVTGEGLVTEVHPVQAFRTFNLMGKGQVVMTGPDASTICLPIDDLPDSGGSGTTIRPIFVFDD